MGNATNSGSYVALRVHRSEGAEGWWAAARSRRDVPRAVVPLLAGRSRVEVSLAEAEAVLAWAGGVDGWNDATPKPLIAHDSNARATLPA